MLCRACVPHVPLTRALAIPTLRLAHTTALRHAPSLAPPAPRAAPSSSIQRPRDALRTRSFATTPRRQAEEGPDMQAMFAQQRKLLQLLVRVMLVIRLGLMTDHILITPEPKTR